MTSTRSFRVLSISGGGVRGVFQAVFLQKLAERIGTKSLYRHFDLIAGTSTGALVALAVALDVDLQRVVNAYRDEGPNIFRSSKWLPRVRRGARYSVAPLRAVIKDILGSKRLADCKVPVLIAATSLQNYGHAIFSTLEGADATDGTLSAVEIAIASAAAPTFFPPAQIDGSARSYVDGGLWANAPAIPALLSAHHQLRVPFDRMALLSLNNGRRSDAPTHGEYSRMRPMSSASAAAIIELVFGSQMSATHDLSTMLLGQNGVVHIDVPLAEEIALDDARRANEVLPPLAEVEAQRVAGQFKQMFPVGDGQPWRQSGADLATALIPFDLSRAAGLTGFYPSRAYYRTHRVEGGSIDRYVASARRSVIMISIHLMTGVAFHDLVNALRSKIIMAGGGFSVTISLLDPEQHDLISVMARGLGDTAQELSLRIRSSLGALSKLRHELPRERRGDLRIRVHPAMPFGSAIMLDPAEINGRIQIETKPYRAPFDKSLAFEITNFGDNEVFQTLFNSYEELMNSGRQVGEDEYQ